MCFWITPSLHHLYKEWRPGNPRGVRCRCLFNTIARQKIGNGRSEMDSELWSIGLCKKMSSLYVVDRGWLFFSIFWWSGGLKKITCSISSFWETPISHSRSFVGIYLVVSKGASRSFPKHNAALKSDIVLYLILKMLNKQAVFGCRVPPPGN